MRADGGRLVIMAHHIVVEYEYTQKLIRNLQFHTACHIYLVILSISSKMIKYVFFFNVSKDNFGIAIV